MQLRALRGVLIFVSVLVLGGVLVALGLIPPSQGRDRGSNGLFPQACLANVADYTFMWWAHGWRGRSPEGHRVFCIQTSRYGLAFDVDDATLTHLGAIVEPLAEEQAVAQSNDVIFSLSTARLWYTLELDNHTYQSSGFALPVDNARIIESGKFMQRMDLLALQFTDQAGSKMENLEGRLEILAWPDRLSLMLHITPTTDIPITAAELHLALDPSLSVIEPLGLMETATGEPYGSPGGLCLAEAGGKRGGIVALNATPGDGSTWVTRMNGVGQQELIIRHTYAQPWGAEERHELVVALMPVAEKAREVGSAAVAAESHPLGVDAFSAEGIAPYKAALPVHYDRARGWYEVALGRHDADWEIGQDLDRTERVRLTLRNADDVPRVVRLNLAKDYEFQGVVGMSPMIRDADGHPTGLPVQISKNWHGWVWFHGLTMLTLPPRSTVPLEFTMAYARWGGVPAASHAQLCLVGWGTHQLWDESAVGCFGESICYDPDINLNRSMIDDMRPLMVWSMGQGKEDRTKWGWTNNVGGGDFLVYYDPQGTRQYLSRMRTSYRRYCPNLTEVIYAGVTGDGHISAQITVSTGRTDDYVRGYYRIHYEILQDTPFKRLAFFQLGADDYNNHRFAMMARGNVSGLSEAWQPERGTFGYSRVGLACVGEEPWFALYRAPREQAISGAWANRGLVIRAWRARLGGQDAPIPFAATFGTFDGMVASTGLELSPPPEMGTLYKGDFVEAEVEMLILPQFAEDYYGPNEALKAALAAHPDSWELVWREAAGNALQVSLSRGSMEKRYPLCVRVARGDRAELSIRGGVGYVPISFVGLSRYRDLTLERNDGQGWQRVDQAVFGNDFWQTDYDPKDRTWTLTYNVVLAEGEDRADQLHLRLKPR